MVEIWSPELLNLVLKITRRECSTTAPNSNNIASEMSVRKRNRCVGCSLMDIKREVMEEKQAAAHASSLSFNDASSNCSAPVGGIFAMKAADLCNSPWACSTSELVHQANPENVFPYSNQVDDILSRRSSEVAAFGTFNSVAIGSESMPNSLCLNHNVHIKLEPDNLPSVVHQEPATNTAKELAGASVGAVSDLDVRVQSKVECLAHLVGIISHLHTRGYEIDPRYLDGIVIKRQNQ